MQYTVAEYTVRKDKLKTVKSALAKFVSQVRRHEPRTLYLVFGDDTQCAFVHVMAFEDDAAERQHSQSGYAETFARNVSPHCVGKPVFSQMHWSAASRQQWLLPPPTPAPTRRGALLRQRRRRAPSLRYP